MMYPYIRGLLMLTAIFFFVGCGDDDGPTGPDNGGSFSATISGDFNKSISGTAIFGSGSDPETGEQGFALMLSTDGENMQSADRLWLVRIGATRPGTGQMPIGNVEDLDEDEYDPQVIYAFYSGEESIWSSVSGILSVNTSSSNQFAGSFEFSATGFTFADTDEEQNVTIEGEFNAVGGDIFFPGF